MAFHKKNPLNDGNVRTKNWDVTEICYEMIVQHLKNSKGFLDLTQISMPDQRVFTDMGHMIGYGNRTVASALVREVESRNLRP